MELLNKNYRSSQEDWSILQSQSSLMTFRNRESKLHWIIISKKCRNRFQAQKCSKKKRDHFILVLTDRGRLTSFLCYKNFRKMFKDCKRRVSIIRLSPDIRSEKNRKRTLCKASKDPEQSPQKSFETKNWNKHDTIRQITWNRRANTLHRTVG